MEWQFQPYPKPDMPKGVVGRTANIQDISAHQAARKG